jgi:hypothetical protein
MAENKTKPTDASVDDYIASRASGCFRHQLLLCCHRHPVIDHAQDDCANLTFCDNQRSIVVGKISLNVSRRVVNPACIASVLISSPNFSAL